MPGQHTSTDTCWNRQHDDGPFFTRLGAGLYGNLVPTTVANFCSAVKSGLYTGTLWSKVLPGEYIQAGQQGSRRTGAVDIRAPESVLSRNQEVLSSKSFRLAGQL